MNRSLEVLIAPDGTLTIDALGFKGADCDQATKFLEQALGLIAGRANNTNCATGPSWTVW
jgi:hypothetical protein